VWRGAVRLVKRSWRRAPPRPHVEETPRAHEECSRTGDADPEGNWRRIEELFSSCAELPEPQRHDLLERVREEEPEVVAEVESLLAVRMPSWPFLEHGPGATDAAALEEPLPSLDGRTIGPFRLLDALGSGGMGTVYRAERTGSEFRQQVAIKVIAAAGWHGDALRRFKTERQALASLHHPHVVALLDGGATPDGLPYLVMEYVEGVPITTYCSRGGLDLEARLRLFRQVCGAVQYAHRHSVVHRDLKPANILVTPDGVPKILDFGIARLLTGAAGEQHTTSVWLRPLTPGYASPEQIRGLPASTTDDVYALGVLLYELLTGQPPHQTEGGELDRMLRLVLERTPPKPSAAASRDREPVRASDLTGDLDAIVLRALDKDLGRRYGSAQDLADDLGRHLAGRPVTAREPSLAYVLATLARRHRTLLAAAALSLTAMLLALAFSLVQARIARAERDRADRRFGEVRRLANTLIFDIHDAVMPLPGSTPVRERIVGEALVYLEHLAAEAKEQDLRLELAKAYHRVGSVQGKPSESNLGDREGAVRSYRRAIELLAPAAGHSREAALELAGVQLSLAATASTVERPDQARDAARTAEATANGLLASDPGDSQARRLLGSALFHQASLATVEEAPPLWLRAAEVFEELLAAEPDDPDRRRNAALVAKYLGENYRQAGALDAALAQHLRAQQLDELRVAADPTNRQAQLDLAIDWASVGGIQREQGNLAEAALSLERSLAVRQALADTDPENDFVQGRLAHAHALVGAIYRDLGRIAEGLEHVRRALEVTEARRELDPQSRLLLAQYLVELGSMELEAGERLSGCARLRRASGVSAGVEGPLDGTFESLRKANHEEIERRLAECARAR
jgi:eukaryotic-like serine/threonine-protein kinase